MFFGVFAKGLKTLDKGMAKIRKLRFPSDRDSGYFNLWLSNVNAMMSKDKLTCANLDEIKRDKIFLDEIKRDRKDIDRMYSKIDTEYLSAKISIQLGLLATFFWFLYPSVFLKIIKDGKCDARLADNYVSMWYDSVKLFEDKLAEDMIRFEASHIFIEQ